MAAAWALVIVLGVFILAGMTLAPVLGVAKDGADWHGVSIPRFDPKAIDDPPPPDELYERESRRTPPT